MTESRTRIIAEVAVVIALAKALDLIVRLLALPQGGAVSLAMLPLFVLALYRGPLIGVAAGALYGIVDLWPEPFLVHWAQLVLDYPLAYAGVGLAGLFSTAWLRSVRAAEVYVPPSGDTPARTQHALRGLAVRWRPWMIASIAILFGATFRYAAHVASGVVFFGEYAPEGQPILVYSLIYNSFVFAAAGLCIIASWAVLPALRSVYRSREVGG